MPINGLEFDVKSKTPFLSSKLLQGEISYCGVDLGLDL